LERGADRYGLTVMANSGACKVPLMRMGIVNRRDDERVPGAHWMVSAPATVTGRASAVGADVVDQLHREAVAEISDMEDVLPIARNRSSLATKVSAGPPAITDRVPDSAP
jgi:hypothetical protein